MIELIQEAKSFVQQNGLLTAGMGTAVVGGALMYFRSLPGRIYNRILSFYSIYFTVDSSYQEFGNILTVLTKYKFDILSRSYSLGKKTSAKVDEWGDSLEEVGVVAGYGKSYGKYKGVFFSFSKDRIENRGSLFDQVNVTFYTKNKSVIDSLTKEAALLNTEEEDSLLVRFSNGNSFGRTTKKAKRSMDSVFVSRGVKESIFKRIEGFKNNRNWYRDRGIPYKLCIVLTGMPGCGKTSLIRAVASHYNKEINFMTSLSGFSQACDYLGKNDMVVIEDIDALGELDKRDLKEDKEQSDVPFKDHKSSGVAGRLQEVLNTLDGLQTPEGVIFFITTNCIESLDSALKRPGRVDEIITLEPLDFETMSEMYGVFYDKPINKADFASQYTPLTGAVLQDIFLNNDADRALEIMREKSLKKDNVVSLEKVH